MPLYEYRCRSCDSRFETYVRARVDPVNCPECRADTIEKLVSSFALTSGGTRGMSSGSGGCGRGGCGCRH